MQKVIVTGGAGFIGSNLVDKLIERGIKVTIIDNLSTGKIENVNPKAKLHILDISRHKNQIENLIALCRACHIKAETDKQFNNQLRELNKHKHIHSY